jgi:hypothetical protein
MITPRITSMRFSCSPARKVPKAGDMRWLKGRKVWQVRQQEKHQQGYVVSNGRPVWEWVNRGSDRDREWRYTAAQSTENDTEGRRYFEDGCLCLIAGQMHIIASESNQKAVARYMAECKCSRHPEHGRSQL